MYKKPHKIIQIFLIVFTVVLCITFFKFSTYSGEIEDLENQIGKMNEELIKKKGILSEIEKKIAEISGSNYSLSQKIEMINSEISKLKKNIDNTEENLNKKIQEIEEKQRLLEKKKDTIDSFSSDLYMQSRYRMSQFFLSKDNWENFVEGLFVKKRAITVLKEEVEKINGEFVSLSESRDTLERQKIELEDQKKDLDKSYALLATEKAKLQKELNTQIRSKTNVSNQINKLTSQLSNLQKALLYARQGGTSVDPSQVASGSSDLGSLATFTKNAPVGYFGVFSIGAYTHRNGMSQWGARERAEAGQTYTQILKAYYPSGTITNNFTEPSKIRVKGAGVDCSGKPKVYDEKIDFSTYMNRIYEMPSGWSPEAVKAQAIVSRTFAIYKINTQGFVIPSESNQVYKNCDNLPAWKNAVTATQGTVLTKNGTVYSTQFAAVHGGWVNGVGWDTYDTSKPKDFTNTWDNKSGVSWIYRSWYRRDYKLSTTIDSYSCYRAPWLSPQELADIVNAASILIDMGNSGATDPRIYPIFDKCHKDGNPYSFAEMREKSSSKFTKIILVQVSRSNGSTTSIKFVNEDGRAITVSGSYFKLAYNLRAPGYLSIPQASFVHVDIQKKL